MTDISCKNRAMALTALDAIAATMQGTQRAVVLAVKAWVKPRKGTCPKAAG